MPDPEQEEQFDERDHIKEIKEKIKVRTAAQNNLKFFAILKENGGCTKAFYDMEDVTGHIKRFGPQWRHFVKLKQNIMIRTMINILML